VLTGLDRLLKKRDHYSLQYTCIDVYTVRATGFELLLMPNILIVVFFSAKPRMRQFLYLFSCLFVGLSNGRITLKVTHELS